MIEIKKTIKEYKNFYDTFKYAYIGLPKGFMGIKKPYFGQLYKLKKEFKNYKEYKEKFPLVLFIHGSKGLNKGTIYRK